MSDLTEGVVGHRGLIGSFFEQLTACLSHFCAAETGKFEIAARFFQAVIRAAQSASALGSAALMKMRRAFSGSGIGIYSSEIQPNSNRYLSFDRGAGMIGNLRFFGYTPAPILSCVR